MFCTEISLLSSISDYIIAHPDIFYILKLKQLPDLFTLSAQV